MASESELRKRLSTAIREGEKAVKELGIFSGSPRTVARQALKVNKLKKDLAKRKPRKKAAKSRKSGSLFTTGGGA